MILLRLCRNILLRLLVALVIISSLIVPPAFSQETEDSQVFIAGFNAYQQKDYASSIEKLSEVLQKYPDSPLRDMVLFWLSRSYYKTGNQQEAARYLSQFSKEFPDNPLKSTVEEDLLSLASRYEKGEKLPVGAPLAKTASKKAQAEKDKVALAKAEEAKRVAEQKEKERLAAAKAEQDKLAAAKAEEAKRVAEQQEAERQAAVKAEQEKAAAAQAEQARLAAVQAEQDKLAAAKAEEAKRIADQQEAERQAAAKAEQEKAAAVQAEQTRLAAVQAEQDKLAAAKAEEAKRVAEQQETERQAAAKAEQDKAAAAQAEQTRLAAVKAEQDKLAAAKAEEAKRVAELKLAEEKAAAAKIEQEKLAAAKEEEAERLAEQRELERLAGARAGQEKTVTVQAEQVGLAVAVESERVGELKKVEEKAAADKLELEKVAAIKAEQEKQATLKAEEANRLAEQQKAERQAIAKAGQDETVAIPDASRQPAADQEELVRQAIVKSQQKRGVTEKPADQAAEQQKTDAIKAEEAEQIRRTEEANRIAEAARINSIKQAEEKAAADKFELDRLAAAAKAEQERIAQEKAARDKAEQQKNIVDVERQRAEVKAEQEMLAELKAGEAQRLSAAAAAETARLAALNAATEKAAKEEENRRQAAAKAEQARLDELKRADEESASARKTYREKAIGQYKAIIDKYPTSAAAVTAAVKLRELGVVVALPKAAVEEKTPENAQVLKLEVAQFAGFEFNLPARPEAFVVGQPAAVPFEVINRGNGKDSFSFDSAFPANFRARFHSVAAPDVAISQTPELAPGETFKGSIELVIPPSSIDGLRIVHPVKAASRLMAEASQSREIRLVASAPLLRAVVRTDKIKPLPGEQVIYSVALLNVGSTVASDVTFRMNFPAQLEPVDYSAAGFKRELPSVLTLDGLQINSGESRQYSVAFKLKDDSLAGQELSTRAELVNNPLGLTAAFVSNASYVEPQRSITVRNGSERVVAIPGQTLSIPFVVTNSGNVREKFKVASTVTEAKDVIVFNDLNRDGVRQTGEPVVSEIGPLAPREEASVVVEIKTPSNAVDGSQGSVQISFVSEGDAAFSATGTTQLAYSRPVLKLLMSGRDGRLKPGDVASFDLSITNNGSNLGKVVELQSTWPEQLELVAAEPSATSINNGLITWRFKEVGAGEKRAITVSFRVKAGTGVGTAIQVKNILMYEDQLGNRY